MKVSYSWLKSYIPDAPEPQKLADLFTYHVTEVESVDKIGDDTIFDIKILPNRAHDLLSHQGIAKEISSLLQIKYLDPTPLYKVPEAKPTGLKIEINSDKCRRYMGRIVRNVKVGPSPEWVVKHLESIGQRSINNVVDAANIVMYDCGQPIHCFDLDKLSGAIIVRDAVDGEEITTLDNKQVKLKFSNLVIADEKNVLAIAGVKGGKIAEVDANTKNIVIEVANFGPASVRKTAKGINIFTDAAKRFENDLSATLCEFAMLETSALIAEYGATEFEEVVDVYPQKPDTRKLSFSIERVSKILGREMSLEEVEDVLKRYVFEYVYQDGVFTITVPPLRLDLEIEEDIAEEVGRVLGYDKLKTEVPKVSFQPKVSEAYAKMVWARNKLLDEGYNEVMTYAFSSSGEVGVLESASDKKFLRTNLTDGLTESLKLNKINSPLLGLKEVKIFEIGTVFGKNGEEIHVAYNEKNKIIEVELSKFASPDAFTQSLGSEQSSATPSQKHTSSAHTAFFQAWSPFPFIARDISVWVPDTVPSNQVLEVIKENAGSLVVRGPELFDEFKKDGKISYAFRTVFQSNERTLTDLEINPVMEKIAEKIKAHDGWQVR
ncbi:MAG: phenylalanine--tRNA ligase subunit beta [Candidatus Pacebacteria bacterium]|nr:phenylalanine--tRNA ligase subunit beta [Candidatus Paceibacterota bacterium]